MIYLRIGNCWTPPRLVIIVLCLVLVALGWRHALVKHRGDAFVTACSNGDLQKVEMLADKGVSLVYNTRNGLTPLHAAAAQGKVEVVKFLLQRGANVDIAWEASDLKGVTPLHFAVLYDHTNVVDVLVAAGADVAKRAAIGSAFDVAHIYQKSNMLAHLERGVIK